MPLGYTADQFYGLNTPQFAGVVGPGGFEQDPTGELSNPPFMFPGSTRREFGPSGNLEVKTGIKRGFIRMLSEMKSMDFTALAKKRCFFQFNPQTIMRAVSLTEGMYNPLLQDPSQFSLPVPGNANFTFELLFDRSFEVNSQVATTPPPPATSSPTGTPLPAPTDETFLNRLMGGSPADIGVLADIRVLDSIVGQGISDDIIDYILARGEIVQSYISDTSVTTDTGASTGGTTTTSTVDTSNGTFTWNSANAEKALNSNLGNQAFLIPNPVRVVFSSLFMVDGYVQSMAVTFNKFSRTMVPTQCMVTIQMQALYLGFAREKTYLTESLAEAVVKPIEAPTGGTSNLTVPPGDEPGNATLDIIQKNLKRLYVHVSGLTGYNTLSSSYDNNSDEPIPYETGPDSQLFIGGISAWQERELRQLCAFTSPKLGVAIGFPDLKVDDDGLDTIVYPNIGFKDIKTISINGRLKVYRKPFGSLETFDKLTLLDVPIDFNFTDASSWKSNQSLSGYDTKSWTNYKKDVVNEAHWSRTSGGTQNGAYNLYMPESQPGRKTHPCTIDMRATITVEYKDGKSPLVGKYSMVKNIVGWGKNAMVRCTGNLSNSPVLNAPPRDY